MEDSSVNMFLEGIIEERVFFFFSEIVLYKFFAWTQQHRSNLFIIGFIDRILMQI